MRSLTNLLLAASLVLGACTPSSSGGPTWDEEALTEEVLGTLAALTEAMNSHDPERVFSFYRQDASFYYLGCTDVLYGWDAFATRVGPWYRANPDVTFVQEVLTVQLLEPTVAVAALRGSSTEAPALFWTEVLHRGDDGRWRITYEHESWPGCSEPRGPHIATEPGGTAGS